MTALPFPVRDYDRAGPDRADALGDALADRQVLETHYIEALDDPADEFVTLPTRAVIDPLGDRVELGPYSLNIRDAEMLADSLRILAGLLNGRSA